MLTGWVKESHPIGTCSKSDVELKKKKLQDSYLVISRVQGLPAGYVVTGSDLEDVAGGFPDAEGTYSALLWRSAPGCAYNLQKVQA